MDEKAFEDAVAFAMEKELESAQLYENLSRLAKTDRAKAFFTDLSIEEKKHYAALERLDPDKIAGAKIGPILDLKISEHMHEVKFGPEMTYQEILILAMKSEEASRNLYKGMADQHHDDDMRKLFEVLSQAEGVHKLKLETEYDDFVLTDD